MKFASRLRPFLLLVVCLLFGLSMLISGCGSQSTTSSSDETSTTNSSPDVDQSGARTSTEPPAKPLPKPAGVLSQKFSCQEELVAGVTEAGGVLYIPCESTLHAIEASSGQEKWSFPTNEQMQVTPGFEAGTVYVASNNFPAQSEANSHNVYALDATSGKEKWRAPVTDDILTLEVKGGIVYAAGTGKTFAINAADGKIRWSSDHGAIFVVAGKVPGTVLMADIRLVGTNRNATTLYALDESSGREEWRRDFGGAPNALDADSATVYLETMLEYTPDEGQTLPPKITAVDAATGADKWQVTEGETRPKYGDMDNMSPFALLGGNISFFYQLFAKPSTTNARLTGSGQPSTLFVLDAGSGKQKANYDTSFPLYPNVQEAGKSFTGGYAYAINPDMTGAANEDASISYSLSAISLTDGSEAWSVPIKDPPRDLLAVAGVFNGHVYLKSISGGGVWEID